VRALLLAAGRGERLRPLTDGTPKCLVSIKGIPLIDIWISTLFKAGIERILVNTHYLADQVKDHIQHSKYSNKIDIVYEENLLGTGGTIKTNLNYFQGKDGLIIHADNYCLADFQKFINTHLNRPLGCIMTMMTFRTDNPEACGIVELDKSNIVQGFHEKIPNPPGNLANGAVFIISEEVATLLSGLKSKEFDFSKEFIPTVLGRIATYYNDVYHCDIGTLENLKKANDYIPTTIS